MSAAAWGRRLAAPPAKLVGRGLVRARTWRWPAHSRLFTLGERGQWSVEEDAAHLASTARRLGYAVAPARLARLAQQQSVFHASHFEALTPLWLGSSHRLGAAYLHGRPGTPGYPEFDRTFEALRTHNDRLTCIQVTHAEMHELVVSAGVDEARIFKIPIGIDLENFPPVDADRRAEARQMLGLGHSAFVVGSFQKDGVGWGEGLEPKLIKGPDVLVASLASVRASAPELVVLLTGPARGYVRAALEARGIVYRHLIAGSRAELAQAYHALDVYVVTSRQEGGPKGVLEAMASGVPLVSTRVGQAQDLVEDELNGLLADVGDAEAIADAVLRLRDDVNLRRAVTSAGRATSEQYSYERLDAAWASLLDGFVSKKDGHGSP